MGPRSDERGNAAKNFPAIAAQVASMGPRSDERGNAATAFTFCNSAELQWGRALMSAEIFVILVVGLFAGQLQWGRALMSAEFYKAKQIRNGVTTLQWGRALMSAEMLGRNLSNLASSRFNGAAL